jgi:polysaccharide biosynthesis transport protein
MPAPDPITPDVFGGEGGGQGGGAFDLWTFVATARRYWWLIAVGAVGGILAGAVLAHFSDPVFIATGEIRVERRETSARLSLSGIPTAFEGATTPEDLKTIERSFASPSLLQKIAGRIHSGEITDISFAGQPAAQMTADAIAGALVGGCLVALIPDTRLIQVSFTDTDPAMAQRIANIIIDDGIRNEQEQRVTATESSIRHLRDEVKKFEENLRDSEEKLNTYTRTLGNVSIDSDINLVANQLRDLTTRLTAVTAERLRLESEYSQVKTRIGDTDKLMEIDSIKKLPTIVTLGNQIADSQSKIDKLALRYRENSPFIVQARSELAALQQALEQEILNAPRAIEAAMLVARESEANLMREQQIQEERVIQVRDLSVPSRVLQRQIDADRLAYEAAMKRLTEELSYARNQPVFLHVVNWAGYGNPSGSGLLKLLGVALFAGTMLGFGGVFLIMQLDTSIRSPEEAGHLLGLPVLTSVPEDGTDREENAPAARGPGGFFRHCPALDDTYSPAAEAFRGLRAALRSHYEEETGHAILLAGSIEGEGATFCALNLAVVFAQAGQRTLLVDANLREPAIEEYVFETRKRTGLSEYLAHEADFAPIIHASPLPLLDIVPAGAPTPFPAESLSRERFARLLAAARPYYDKIVVDSAPLATFSDTLGFARLIPFLCLVVGIGHTPRKTAKQTIERLTHAGARVTGLVVNSSPKPNLRGRAEEDRDGEDAAFSKPSIVCPSCGKIYPTFGRFMAMTSPCPVPASGPEPGSVLRVCACGAEFAARRVEERDLSRHGEERRKIFGELMRRIEARGISKSDARQHLLLALRILRNEVAGDPSVDMSPAAAERTRLFGKMVADLVAAGDTPEEAKNRLMEAIEQWRQAP